MTAIDGSGAVVTPAALDVARKLGIGLSGVTTTDRSFRKTGIPASEHRSRGISRHSTAPVSALDAQEGDRATRTPLRISIGCDHGGLALKQQIIQRVRELGHSVDDRGTTTPEAVDYPDFAVLVARDVAAGIADLGIMVDGAGIGSCMAANKVAGVRAAMCYDVTTARNAREHNHANLLTLGAGLTGTRLAFEIVDAFLSTQAGVGRHASRVAKIDALLR